MPRTDSKAESWRMSEAREWMIGWKKRGDRSRKTERGVAGRAVQTEGIACALCQGERAQGVCGSGSLQCKAGDKAGAGHCM